MEKDNEMKEYIPVCMRCGKTIDSKHYGDSVCPDCEKDILRINQAIAGIHFATVTLKRYMEFLKSIEQEPEGPIGFACLEGYRAKRKFFLVCPIDMAEAISKEWGLKGFKNKETKDHGND